MRTVRLGPSDFAALAADVLERGGKLRFRAQGWSMQPSIQDGDILHIEPITPLRIRPGQVILCHDSAGHLFAHRVIDFTGMSGRMGFVTKGDSAPRVDSPVTGEQVLGRVVAIQRGQKSVGLERGLDPLVGLGWAKFSALPRWTRIFLVRVKIAVRASVRWIGTRARD